jgi:hypothetical protein
MFWSKCTYRNVKNIFQMTANYNKLPKNIPIDRKLFQMLLKYTQIGNFGMNINHLATQPRRRRSHRKWSDFIDTSLLEATIYLFTKHRWQYLLVVWSTYLYKKRSTTTLLPLVNRYCKCVERWCAI